jgi:hypothetical protein
MSEDFLKDFDVLSPPKRFAKIGGEKIDVSFIPAKAALKFVSFSNKYSPETFKKFELGDTTDLDPEMYDDIFEVVEVVCQRSSKIITKDWLLNNIDFKILMEFVQYIFEGMQGVDSGTPESSGDDEKNSISGT